MSGIPRTDRPLATTNKSSAARRSAESRRCKKCNRKSATETVVFESQVVRYCTHDDCDYESVTDLNP